MASTTPTSPTPKDSKRLTARERKAETIRSAVHSGAWDAITLACSDAPDLLLRDIAGQPDPIGRVAALAQKWRFAVQEAYRRVHAACVLEILSNSGADFQTVVSKCHTQYAMTVQEVILALNDLLQQHVITVKAGPVYLRTDATPGE